MPRPDSEDWEKYFNFQSSSEKDSLSEFTKKEGEKLIERRAELLLSLSGLNFLHKKQTNPEIIDFKSLLEHFKQLNLQLAQKAMAGKEVFANSEKEEIAIYSQLVILKEEGLAPETSVENVIEALSEKYDSMKGVS